MNGAYQKYQFSAISVKKDVASRFRKFSKKISNSHSDTIQEMIDFFEINQVSPNDRLGETISSLKNQIKKRFNGVIAIIRDIEKNQTKPTTAMLHSLFEEASNEEEEEFDFGSPDIISENEELTYYRNEYYKMQKRSNDLERNLGNLLDKIVVEKRSFGKDYLKLNLTQKELENFKNKCDV